MDDTICSIATSLGIGAISIIRVSGKEAIKIVKENIVFALGIKFIVMILGIIGRANMWAAVFADVGVSLIAVLNSLRILFIKKK